MSFMAVCFFCPVEFAFVLFYKTFWAAPRDNK